MLESGYVLRLGGDYFGGNLALVVGPGLWLEFGLEFSPCGWAGPLARILRMGAGQGVNESVLFLGCCWLLRVVFKESLLARGKRV